MATTYLVGYDGSAEARAAVDFVLRLARPSGARVVAVTVEADGASAILEAKGVEQRAVESRSVARGLHDLADELGAGMIAVGVSHHGPLGRLVPGSIATQLLHGATCPVLVVPARAKLEIATVGAAFDGRAESRPALNTAIELAGRLGARVLVLGVHRPAPVPAATGLPADFVVDGRDEFEWMLSKVSFDTHGGAGHRLLTGKPGPALAAASADVDLLVTGSRGHGALRGVVLGSVSRHLVDHAACPVLVVPRPA